MVGPMAKRTPQRFDKRQNRTRGGKGLAGVIYLRVTPDTIAALDTRASEAQKATGYRITRADVARSLILKGLEEP